MVKDYSGGLEHQRYNLFRELLLEFKLQEQEVWTNLTLTLDSKGNFKINYGHEDVS